MADDSSQRLRPAQRTTTATTVFVGSVSSGRLHCCLVILVLFLLIFLSLPLLLIYLANTRYEELHPIPINSTRSPKAPLNCTEYALRANLSQYGDNFQCPAGTFACLSCRFICIEQWQNCNKVTDCPDSSDENYCHDTTGVMRSYYEAMLQNVNKRNKSSSGSILASTLAKPESCSLEQFIDEQCPCVYTDAQVVICEGLGLEYIPNALLSTVYKIRMSNNSIVDLANVSWPTSLRSLVLVNNKISKLDDSVFEMAPNLSKIYLSHNEISYIHEDAFKNLSQLSYLQIESNKLQTFDTKALKYSTSINKIHLSENFIDLPFETRFSQFKHLHELILDHNRISIVRAHWFSNMSRLHWLSLAHNEIAAIEENSFNWDYELEELNLSFNKIIVIKRLTFARMLNIERLHLGGNPLNSLPVDTFLELPNLASLNLTDVEFSYINQQTFAYLARLEFIYFAKFRYCHFATNVRVCRPLTDGLSTVEELLAFPILKYAVWIVASVCSLGNVFVFVWRSVSSHEDRTLSLFVRNLSIADLMMGIYLGAIGWHDYVFQHNFKKFAIEWMSSWKCTAIGFLATLSSELSVLILTIITIERYRSITSISSFEEETRKKRARIYVALAWILAFLIALYPLFEWLMQNSDYYATNGLCLPLHIDQPFSRGWQYSAFVYLGVNFLAVMIIIVLYIHMYTMIMNGRQASRPVLFKAEKREDAILAIRFFFIVVTDCLCWIPIVIIKIMALANVNISSSIYGWLVVFIIPINSALNPIVYTLAAPTSLRAAACRLFERLYYKLGRALTSDQTGGYSSKSSSTSSAGSANSETQVLGGRSTGRRRRRKFDSNSTTVTGDTIETSITSRFGGGVTKSSIETAELIQPLPLPSRGATEKENALAMQTEVWTRSAVGFAGSRILSCGSDTKLASSAVLSLGGKSKQQDLHGPVEK